MSIGAIIVVALGRRQRGRGMSAVGKGSDTGSTGSAASRA